MNGDPRWLQLARKDLGLTEIPGARHAPRIVEMWRAVKAPFYDDETPWCGGAVGAWMMGADIAPPPLCWRAKSWLTWGKESGPVLGAVVVFSRDGGGHVALAVGETSAGRLSVIGGNQSNAVSVASFDRSRVLGYRVPPGSRAYDRLPVVNADGSKSEA